MKTCLSHKSFINNISNIKAINRINIDSSIIIKSNAVITNSQTEPKNKNAVNAPNTKLLIMVFISYLYARNLDYLN